MRLNMVKVIKQVIKNRFNREMEENDINLEDLKRLQEEGAIIIDVRSPQEYQEGHIDGAILIPEYEMKKRAENELKDKTQKIVVYCSSGGRSKKAQKTLRKLGYDHIYNLYNGIINYWDFYKFMLKLHNWMGMCRIVSKGTCPDY